MLELEIGLSLLLIVCLICVCAFEFINGFHDTANAVATVIYTKSLPPTAAVMISGVLNGVGVFLGGTAVAMGIINLLPVETLVDQRTTHSLGMVGAILLTAIFWNLGTWLLAIPASSSHTLIGSILGCGVAYSLLPGSQGSAVNWHKVSEVGLSLLISPLFGFMLALSLMALLRGIVKRDSVLFQAPNGDNPPPLWIRGTLIATCGLVSFSHGSNDGQKGIGLMMLVLIGIIPAKFAFDQRYSDSDIRTDIGRVSSEFQKVSELEPKSPEVHFAVQTMQDSVSALQASAEALGHDQPKSHRFETRRHILMLQDTVKKIKATHGKELGPLKDLFREIHSLKKLTDYAPGWVIVLIAFSLGIGTMIGWKRIVVTIGEKIGKSHLTYAQGASAEVVAASTIAVSTMLGLPVSTTHVLSSGIAGAMFASGGKNNLDKSTITKILLAWLLTLPVCLTMSGTLFLIFRTVFG